MYALISGQQLYFQKTGTGKPLIMLHGWGQNVSSFWPLVGLLKNDFTLYLIDLPGFGRSESPKKTFGVSDYAEIIHAFIKDQKIEKPILLGHSLGGRIAIKLAADNHLIIEKLILEGSAGITRVSSPLKNVSLFLAKIFKYTVPNIFNLKTKLRYKVYKKLESDYLDVLEMKETFKKLLSEDLSNDLLRISIDSLLLWGEKDRAVPLSDAKRMYQQIDKAKLVIFEDIGHFPHLENPKLFSYYVKDFSLN